MLGPPKNSVLTVVLRLNCGRSAARGELAAVRTRCPLEAGRELCPSPSTHCCGRGESDLAPSQLALLRERERIAAAAEPATTEYPACVRASVHAAEMERWREGERERGRARKSERMRA